MINILIADDHKIIVDGLKSLLAGEEDIQVVAEVDNGSKAIKIIEQQKIDVAVMDIAMPVMTGLEATAKIKQIAPEVKIIVLTMYEDEQYFNKIMELGASGYILKNTGHDELVRAIHKVHKGDTYFSQEIVSKQIMRKFTPGTRDLLQEAPLTKREIEVLKLISEEFKNHEIADKLFLSTRTVDTHRRNLLQKLNVKNTAGLVKYAIAKGIIQAY